MTLVLATDVVSVSKDTQGIQFLEVSFPDVLPYFG
jgi:hypothetical protein